MPYTTSHPKPIEASLPETKFSTRTSDCWTNFFTISRPSGFLKLTVIDRLFLLTARKYVDSGGRWNVPLGAFSTRGAEGGLHDPALLNIRKVLWAYPRSFLRGIYPHAMKRNTQRVSSPRETSSTLITSAPRSARSYVQGCHKYVGMFSDRFWERTMVAVGPASTLVRSRTLMPWRGGGIPSGPWFIWWELFDRMHLIDTITGRVHGRIKSDIRMMWLTKSETGKVLSAPTVILPLNPATTTTPWSDITNSLNLSSLHAVKAAQVVAFGTMGTTRLPFHSPFASSPSDARSPTFAQWPVCKRNECVLCRGDVSLLEAGPEFRACVLECIFFGSRQRDAQREGFHTTTKPFASASWWGTRSSFERRRRTRRSFEG